MKKGCIEFVKPLCSAKRRFLKLGVPSILESLVSWKQIIFLSIRLHSFSISRAVLNGGEPSETIDSSL